MGDIDSKLYGNGFLGAMKPTLGPLKRRFLYPPFSVLNTRDGFWQDRKRRWIALGIKSEVGRPDRGMDRTNRKRKPPRGISGRNSGGGYSINADKYSGGGTEIGRGTSIFDPVLTELAYTWWCPPGGIVVDPFAGGSVRGIIASILGLKYWGCELRSEQVEANKHQRKEIIKGKYKPRWVCGDSADKLLEAPQADFLLSCPPYGNLEQYSDDPRDISGMPYEDFLLRYRQIISIACDRLSDDRFACFVVANYRDKQIGGGMRNLVGDTVLAFEDCGLLLYNEAILVNAVGSAAMRANTNFVRGAKKLVKTHQNVLVFVKGDPKKAAERIDNQKES